MKTHKHTSKQSPDFVRRLMGIPPDKEVADVFSNRSMKSIALFV